MDGEKIYFLILTKEGIILFHILTLCLCERAKLSNLENSTSLRFSDCTHKTHLINKISILLYIKKLLLETFYTTNNLCCEQKLTAKIKPFFIFMLLKCFAIVRISLHIREVK